MKKGKKIISLILISGAVGFLLSFLIHEGYWSKLIRGFKSVNFFFIFVVLLAFFITILVHELGHLFSFLFTGIKIRALYVLLFVLKKTKKGWKFELYPPLIKILGGMVVPDLDTIETDEEFKNVVNKFSKALIMGPITSIIFWIVITVTFILVWFLTNNYLMIGILAVSAITITLLTILVIASSKLHTDVLYGDFIAYDKMKNDELFQLNQITQYIGFSLNDHKKTNEYLFNKIEKYLVENKVGYNLFEISLLSQYISLFNNKDNPKENKIISDKIDTLSISYLTRSEMYNELPYLISSYYYKMGNVKKSYDIFYLIKSYNKEEENNGIMFIQYEHMLNIKDHTKLFENMENPYFGDLWLLKPLYEKEDLISDYKYKLEFQEYKTEINCFIK